MTRVKWELPALMVLVLALGAWLVWTNKTAIIGLHPAANSRTIELRIGNSRGIVEITESRESKQAVPDGPHHDVTVHRFRVMLRDGFVSEPLSTDQFRAIYGQRTLDDALTPGGSPLFRLLNITNWSSLIWASLGLLGQAAFFGRMFVQWVVSEKEKRSVVPPTFWWFSLAGGVLLFTYFVWRQDFVGVLGQSTGIVIYARNIRLIAKHRRAATPTTPA